MVTGFNKSFVAVTLGSLLLLSACEKADEKASLTRGGEGQATFLLKDAEGEGELINPDAKASWQAPIASSFSFKACLKDRGNGENAIGQKFIVERAEDGSQITPKEDADTNGCIKWEEPFDFNYFAKRSARLPITRYIVGQGVHSGREAVRFAINPWSLGNDARDKGKAVEFLRDKILPEKQLVPTNALRPALSGDLYGAAELWIPKVEITSHLRKAYTDGQVIDLNFEVSPRVKYQNMNGETMFADLRSGEFDVIAHLIVTDSGANQTERVLLTPVALQDSGKIQDGTLRVTARTSLERRVTTGNLELALKLIPKGIGSLRSLKTFEAIFELGDVNDISRGPRGNLTQACRNGDRSCNLETALNTTMNFAKLSEAGHGLGNEPYIFSNLKLRYISVEPGETATQRNVAYNVSTCVKSRWNGRDVADTPFTIEYLDEAGQPLPGRTQTRKSNEEGCLSWESTIFHKFYQPERLYWHQVRISLNKDYQRILRFALNPWDDKFTFGWDEREFSKEFITRIQNRKKIPSRFFLADFGYKAIRFLYNIDQYMELEVKKTVLLELSPRVLRYSGIVNARQQTENLRDGLYMMKVAIQKDYLDPAEGNRVIKNQREAIPSAVIEELGGKVARKEYITSQTYLVRVADGKIIHPIELTMRDLRLMRTRANFLIQLETVDERLVQAHQVLSDQMRKDILNLQEKRKTLNEMPVDQRESHLQTLATERKEKLESAFFQLKEHLENERPSLDSMDLTLDETIMGPIKAALETNDFTEVKFPSNGDIDLNNFLEKDSGLEKRTFVGPVIFLSNGYSDSVRATDNIDEARCHEPFSADLVEKGLSGASTAAPMALSASPRQPKEPNPYKWEELKLFGMAEKDAAAARQNNAYRFSKYYGSLKHLCGKSVDDIIKREKEMNEFYNENMPIAASMYNFVSLNNLEFMSLGNEQLTKLDTACTGPIASCVQTTTERTVQPGNMLNYLNHKSVAQQRLAAGRGRTNLIQAATTKVQTQQLPALIFGDSQQPETRLAMCAMLSGRAAERLESVSADRKKAGWFQAMWTKIWNSGSDLQTVILEECLDAVKDNPKVILTEERLRVKETGKYTFLGGLQLNLNVGESFSVGRSDSWGYSFKPLDLIDGPLIVGGAAIGAMIGGPPGAMVGAGVGYGAKKVADLIKPLSLSYGGSLSGSEGTSVSQSTYLVAQIARFNLQMNNYERCRVIRFDPAFALKLSTDTLGLESKFAEHVARGFFVCKGVDSTEPLHVEESYFYFTQHFTEGDMLDQADLYNHPWLLALRGVREFATFVNFTNAQEIVNLKNFKKGAWTPEKRSLGWPLAHMQDTYLKTLPTFPGLYTLVRENEKMPTYPHQGRYTTDDEDINAEVRCNLDANKNCVQKTMK